MLLVGRQLLVVRVVTCAVMGKVDCGFETFSVASKLSNFSWSSSNEIRVSLA